MAMIKAIKKGEEGILAAYSTVMHLMDFGFKYIACGNRETRYSEAIGRMRRVALRS